MQAGKTYDPFAMERPTFKLGDRGEWPLEDVTEENVKQIDALVTEFNELVTKDDLPIKDAADVVGRLLEVICEDAKGLCEDIVMLTDPAAAKANGLPRPLGMIALRGAVQHVLEWIYGEQTAGNG